jgi:hypothetical protein
MSPNYHTHSEIGRARHVVTYHDGVKQHPDGSPFYDIHICRTARKLDTFVKELEKKGYRPTRVHDGLS